MDAFEKAQEEATPVKIRFKEGFSPDRISGTKKKVEELGIKILSKKSKDSWMWDYENPDVKMPNKDFEVLLEFAQDEDYGDLMFKNGVVFGYVDEDDFEVVSSDAQGKSKR
jgi:hypothetical protein